MRVEVIRPDELSRSEISAWHAMQRATPSLGNPFLSPEYAKAAGAFRPQSRVAVLTEGSRVTGFFPFERRRLGVGVPVSGWLSACQGVVHEPGAEWDAAELIRRCGLAAWKFDNLLPEQKPFEEYHAAFRITPVIDLSSGFNVYYKALYAKASRFCRELERKARKMEREVGMLDVQCGSPALDALRTLISWKSDQYCRTGHVDRFKDPWVRELLEILLASQAAECTGILSVLTADGQPVAAQFGLRGGNLLVGWFTGYDPRYAKYSPGIIHLLRMAEHVAAHVNAIHMGKGARNYTQNLKNDDVTFSEGAVITRSTLGAAYGAYDLTSRHALDAARRSPRLHATFDTVLRRTGVSRRTYGRL